MTCVLLPPWQPFFNQCSPMNPALPPSIPSDYVEPQYRSIASESESTQTSNESSKKRSSRAGTRSVSTLSAAQLERKRANDRDAQRAIRQRTKDHIDGLEKTISDLRKALEDTEKVLTTTQQQNRAVLEENAYLRTKLGEIGSTSSMTVAENLDQWQPARFVIPSRSPIAKTSTASNQLVRAPSTPPPALSLETSHSSDSQHSSWQSNAIQGPPANPRNVPMMYAGVTPPNWRSHGGSQGAHVSSGEIQGTGEEQSHTAYGASTPLTQWTVAQQPHPYTGQHFNQHFRSTSLHQQLYGEGGPPNYNVQPSHQQPAYPVPATMQTDLQSGKVESPVVFHQPVQYMMSPAHLPGAVIDHEAASLTAHMQPPVPASPALQQFQGSQEYTHTTYPPAPFGADSARESLPPPPHHQSR